MNIVDCKVLHKKWGKGIINAYNGGILSVRFQSMNIDAKPIRFSFPDAFIDGFLIAADDSSAYRIDAAIRSCTCSVCGKVNNTVELIDDKYLCVKCQRYHVITCKYCKKKHLKSNMVKVARGNIYNTEVMCLDCSEEKSFMCEECGVRYINANRAQLKFNGKVLCNSCFDELTTVCDFCGKVIDINNAVYVDDFSESVLVKHRNKDVICLCEVCAEQNTFICKNCEHRKLNSDIMNSKFIPASELICKDCVEFWAKCDRCGETIMGDDVIQLGNYTYCPECYDRFLMHCPYCNDAFVPNDESQDVCPDCVRMREHVKKVQEAQFINKNYVSMSYYSLENINRCELFTHLYEHYRNLNEMRLFNTEGKPFYYLVIDMYGYRLVVAYFPVTPEVKYLANITMSKFRTREGRITVIQAIERAKKFPENYVMTSAGQMRIFDYPILLRVQTEHDKKYRKEWNGPGEYVEICNYGDTTDFKIIGIL